jgi:hypothetical protein
MKTLDIRVRSRLRQANSVAQNNKRLAAEQLYRELLAEEPDLAEAWAGLGNVLLDDAEKESAYEKALSFDPENEIAQRGLGILRGDIVEEVVEKVEMPASPPPPAPLTATPTTAPPSKQPETHTHEPAPADDAVLFCANHPDRETNLRCNKCNKPVCTACIKRTPVGYRCKECIHEQEEVFFTAELSNYLIAGLITVPLAVLGAYIVPVIGFFSIFLAPAVGTGIGRLAFLASGRQRGRYMPHMVAGIIAGIAVFAILSGYAFIALYGFFGGGAFSTILATLANLSPGFLWGGVYAFAAASSAFYQMK